MVCLLQIINQKRANQIILPLANANTLANADSVNADSVNANPSANADVRLTSNISKPKKSYKQFFAKKDGVNILILIFGRETLE